ncbi:27942_t:CDS:2 [Dentiscutata erythropus]|uniref:27942_t:CDS:1 n=1 Tax=Dentiscutata erythropus TaxID=1348616 RepID=A0A9N9IGE1_9GLOM|nr:27942_t:CDS:2 [Dentiscutata erythropus]
MKLRIITPPVKQIFSFSDEDQDAIIEPLLNLVENSLNEFLIKNQHMIPFEVIKGFASKQYLLINPNFSNADTLNMLNFIIENINLFDKSVFHSQHKSALINLFKNFKNNVRYKMAYSILIDQKGRWSNHALQNVTILACDVVTYLEVNETKKKSKQKIMKMALRENEDLIQIWRVVKTTECRKKQSYEFIDFVNLTFGLDLKYIGIEVEQSKFCSDSPEAKQVM